MCENMEIEDSGLGLWKEKIRTTDSNYDNNELHLELAFVQCKTIFKFQIPEKSNPPL